MCLQEKYPWIDTATSEDFPTEDLKLMAGIIGMPATIKLLTEATGCVFTMTKYWDRELIKKYRMLSKRHHRKGIYNRNG